MNERILIIDDEPDVLATLDTILNQEGFQVKSSTSSEDAIKSFQSTPFDLVITDIRMPGMDGLEVINQIKQLDGDMEIIVLTGYASLENAIQALSGNGAFEYLIKPLENIDKLTNTVNRALEKRRLRLENKIKPAEFSKANEELRIEITERKRAVENIEHLNSVLGAIKFINHLTRIEKDCEKLLQSACEFLIEAHCYHNVWIAILDKNREVVTTAKAGLDSEFLSMIDHLNSYGLTDCVRRALKKSDIVVIKDPVSTCQDCPLLDIGGNGRAMTMRLEHDGTIYGLIFTTGPKVFLSYKEMQSLFKEIGDDLSFALHNLAVEEQRKLSEEALRVSETQKKAILDASIDRIRLVDADMRILWANKTTTRELKIPPEDIVGQFCYRIFMDKDSPCPECPTTKSLKSGIIEHAILHKIMSKSFKEETYWDNYAVPIKNESGDIVNCIQVARNITDSKKAEEEKKKLEARLHQAKKMETLGTLVAGVAHEINNPINLIMFNLPLLEKVWYDFLPFMKEHASKEPDRKYGGLTYDFLKENLNTLLSDMKMASNRVAKIVMDLKTFSRQSNMAEKQPIKIDRVLKNAIRLAQAAIRESEVDLELDMVHDLPLIEGNFQDIEQIVLNLIINAIQSIEHNQGKVKIKTGFQKKDERIFISISDNGRGIDPTISDNIFEPFFTDKQAAGGIGLGLSITYNLVRAYEGEITFKSRKGKGTTFIVYFPTISKRKAAKILVVDDDKSVCDFLTEVLTREKIYQVEEAINGVDACIKLGSFCPDLLILDIFMPEMDGLEVLRTIQTKPELSDIQVIITTGFPDHLKLKEAAEMGFTNIYIKPIKLQDILKGVDTVLNIESKE